MTQEVDSSALLGMRRVMGLSGRGAGETSLDDGFVTQVIDVNEIVRRSRTPASSSGFFIGLLRNVHSIADDEQSLIDPYTTQLVNGGYPSPVPAHLDVWILDATIVRTSGIGALTGGQLRLATGGTDNFTGWGRRDDAGDISTNVGFGILAQWDGIDTSVNNGLHVGIERGSGLCRIPLGVRVRRGMTITFDTTAGAAANFDCLMTIGLFPEGLGQDLLSG